MKKIFIYVTSFIFLITFLITPVGSTHGFVNSPKSEREDVTSIIFVDSNLTIEKTEDGRVSPIKNANKLTISQLDSILTNMNVNHDQISNMPLPIKQKVVSRGGVAVPITTTKKTEHFVTPDGKQRLVTEENKEEIDKIKQQEISKLNNSNNNSGITPFSLGSERDGSFYGYSLLMYRGSTAAELEYEYIEYFSYDANVNYKYTDRIAHAWNPHTVSIGREAGAQYKLFGIWANMNVTTSHNDSTTGASASIKLPNTQIIEETFGYFIDTVRIPKIYSGTTGKWVVKYAHPYSVITPSVNIGAVSITYSPFLGKSWSWENTFTIA
ncbi:hypothetical protein [Paenibacillus paeoniae]|uniref:Uncharacterized protein n=1 Tax=Paenibacillus paeoniae TaxID=2292705 RepID=A0A371PL19_9BACL|nr:hypothetical protein [Paenibacillus paeoniae]REK76793.1 hypothetical protein DX130_07105 [Paenibacillus paeoniae]